MKNRIAQLLVVGAVAMTSTASFGQQIPLRNWSAPSSWKPSASAGRQIVANADATLALPFVAVTPCRAYDSRVSQGGAGPLASGTTRNIDIDGSSCGPFSAFSSGVFAVAAYSINITVFGSASSSNYQFLTAYPAGGSLPAVSSLNFLSGTQETNAVVVAAGAGGDVAIYTSLTTEFVIDINGYYSTGLNNGQWLGAVGNYGGGAILFGQNSSTTLGSSGVTGDQTGAAKVYGVKGRVSSAALSESAGVYGLNQSNAGSAFGVLGEISSTAPGSYSTAVRGVNAGTGGNGIGVWGSQAGGGYGVYGTANTGTGVYGSVNGGTGVAGESLGSVGATYGVSGYTASSATGAAGTLGIQGGAVAQHTTYAAAGVRGLSLNYNGVLGMTQSTLYAGVRGIVTDSNGNSLAQGNLGYPGVSAAATYGVYAQGNMGATGTKTFVEPHPTDPNLVIRYVSLEGNEAGTYFRGRAQTEGKRAVIKVPKDFAYVTDPEGITVQITPIGDFANFAVVHAGLDGIEIKSTRETEFYYTVNGVRKAFRDFRPITEGGAEYIPESKNARLPAYLPEELKQRLIANGTYNADGTVNMNTAVKNGWAAKWQQQEKQ